ncbi:MAG: lipocalin family protein [Armatimonadetes bacterium]|nr:lipocalin family protein [Armatimonadota bacterium]
MKKLLVASSFIVASLALGSNPVGVWQGKLNINMPKGAMAHGDPAEMDNMVKKSSFKLEFKADHTYNVNAKTPREAFTTSGTWVQNGNKITVTPKIKNGKPFTAKPIIYQISLDGKSIIRDIQPGVSIVFSKG